MTAILLTLNSYISFRKTHSCCSSGSDLEIQVKQNAICSLASNCSCGDVFLMCMASWKNALAPNAASRQISVTSSVQRFCARRLSLARLEAILKSHVFSDDSPLKL